MSEMRFILIIPFYNARNYLRECLDSILMQSHRTWLAVCADDHSEDGSSNLIPTDPRIIRRYNEQRVTALPNIYNAITRSGIEYDDHDVICNLDGDDRLLEPRSLEIIADIYNRNPHCLLTYGQYVTSSGNPGHCKPYLPNEFKKLRQKSFRASHLRTFKWKLYKEFLHQDPQLLAYRDDKGSFFTMASDLAIMFPLMEIAGYPNIVVNEKPVYWYRLYERNDHIVDREKQQNIDAEIRSKPIFIPTFLPIYYRVSTRLYSTTRQLYRWIKNGFLQKKDLK